MKRLWGSSMKVPSRAVRLTVTVTLVMGAVFFAAPTASAETGRTTAAQVSRAGLVPAVAEMQVGPTSGPGGTQIDVRATGLPVMSICRRLLEFRDAAGIQTLMKSLPITDSFRTRATIPTNAALGPGTVLVWDVYNTQWCLFPLADASAGFTVTTGS